MPGACALALPWPRIAAHADSSPEAGQPGEAWFVKSVTKSAAGRRGRAYVPERDPGPEGPEAAGGDASKIEAFQGSQRKRSVFICLWDPGRRAIPSKVSWVSRAEIDACTRPWGLSETPS